jgi:hypothetical protein
VETAYLERLRRDSGALDWLAAVGLQDGETPAVTLGSVYTALLTTRPDPDAQRRELAAGERRLSALAVLNREPHLVLTGDPGSGKSAFVNFLALCLAGERLAGSAPNLKDLTEPLPGEDGQDQAPDKAPPQPWDQGARIPVRVILRDFAASPALPRPPWPTSAPARSGASSRAGTVPCWPSRPSADPCGRPSSRPRSWAGPPCGNSPAGRCC